MLQGRATPRTTAPPVPAPAPPRLEGRTGYYTRSHVKQLQLVRSLLDRGYTLQAVEKALQVTTDPPVEGSWAWLPDEAEGSRVHWRTREYYPAGAKVRVDAKLYGVSFGDGAYGAQDATLTFEIGRRQVVKAEASSHRIQVLDAQEVEYAILNCAYAVDESGGAVTQGRRERAL